jgi:hypothetical protein
LSKDRLEQFKENEHLGKIDGFAESLIEAEKKYKKEVKQGANFSRKEYEIMETAFWMGKYGEWYFIGRQTEVGNKFEFFENKKMIQMYLLREFKGLEVEDKGFWMNEVETF